MRAVSSESGEKERGGEKGEENWLVGPVHGKERKGKNGIRLRKEISFGGVERKRKRRRKMGRSGEEAERGGSAGWKGVVDSEWDGLSHVMYSIAFRAATPRIDRTNISCTVGSVYSYLPPAGLTNTGHDHLLPFDSRYSLATCRIFRLYS